MRGDRAFIVFGGAKSDLATGGGLRFQENDRSLDGTERPALPAPAGGSGAEGVASSDLVSYNIG